MVCLVGLEQGLFPSYRSLDDPASLEGRAAAFLSHASYVGITRAKERLFLSHASERRLWGGMREPAVPSIFLAELPEALVQGDIPRSGGAALRRSNNGSSDSRAWIELKHSPKRGSVRRAAGAWAKK